MSPEARRDAIVDAALAVMQRKGISATTVRDVAAEMGTSSGLIHHYVESMDDLVAEAFARAAGADLAAMEAALTADDALGRLQQFLASYSRTEGDATMQLWLDAWADAVRRPALQETSRRLNREWQRLIAGIVADGVAEGSMRSDDPEAAAWRLLSLLDGLALQAVAHRGSLSRRRVAEWSGVAAENELSLAPGTLALEQA